MYAVGFPGIPDLVVQPEGSSTFFVDKIEDGRHLTKSLKFVSNIFFIILYRIEFMTLVSTIGFFYTHNLVALSRNQNGGHQTNKIGNR